MPRSPDPLLQRLDHLTDKIATLREELESWKRVASQRAGEILHLRARVLELERAAELPASAAAPVKD